MVYEQAPARRREIFITGTISHEALVDIFTYHHHPEAGNVGSWAACAGKELFDTFLRCEYDPKIEVSGLDPFIARLVKTLNEIGIKTTYSCDGD